MYTDDDLLSQMQPIKTFTGTVLNEHIVARLITGACASQVSFLTAVLTIDGVKRGHSLKPASFQMAIGG